MPASLAPALLLLASGVNAAAGMQYGIGDRYDQLVGGRRVVVYKEAEKDGLKFKYAALWLVPGWTHWLKKEMLVRIAEDGYTPLLLYYTFGDKSSKEYLEADEGARIKAWREDIEKNLAPLADIGSEVLIALEPEFNVVPGSGTPITSWPEWNEIAAAAIDSIRAKAPLAKVGLCPGDWGNYNLYPSMHRAAKKSDFIAFPEMRASTDPSTDPRSPRYQDVGQAAVDFAAYLKRTFNKPLLFAYLALSSFEGGDPLGWESVQARMLEGVFDRERELAKHGVFGVAFFAYFDDPGHGTEFFGEAEKHFGLKDASGATKKAWRVWKERTSP